MYRFTRTIMSLMIAVAALNITANACTFSWGQQPTPEDLLQ